MKIKLQTLVSTMNQKDYTLLDKMNIQTDAIIGNQGVEFDVKEFMYGEYKIKWLSFNEKGVGLNRNNALMRASGDILLFADDDVCYVDGYDKKILRYYEEHPDAEVVIFNLTIYNQDGTQRNTVKRECKGHRFNITSYGTPCITVRRKSLRMNNIYFHLDFGGGATYSCGEDTLFLQECAKRNMKIYISPQKIGEIYQGESSWFCGYNEKYFFDKGVLFYLINKRACHLFALYHCYKHKKLYVQYGWKKAYMFMRKGIKYISKKDYM